ncbi:hypothetical protein GXP67_05230 [Rhodocytophaga rosea]|uniref:histidine kinase n=1 Tax=Rhodocytophaga rosea TaxID=2704465 RepID=A0A6C0GEB0_9BACT|nr:ATP-binding protein [Rhodocytophaga rosea]QHT66113.1 hypothetical protein GXP67_05230 [Rhodocytophaga rosea]
MQTIAGEIQFVIAITFFLILITSFVIVFMFIHQNNSRKYLKYIEEVKNTYEQEILKARLEMQEQTFLGLSQEIHDNIGQILSLIRLNISTIKPEDPLTTSRKISASKELLDKAIEDLRDLSKRLNTEYVIKQTLSESLQFQVGLIQKIGLYDTSLDIQGNEFSLDGEKKLIVFRIAQEALNNIIKHAKATKIKITLSFFPGQIQLNIQDNGRGFETFGLEKAGNGLGTHNMYYRAKLIGASFSLQSKSGEGTLAHLILPVSINN